MKQGEAVPLGNSGIKREPHGPSQSITDLRRQAERMTDSIKKNSNVTALLSEWKEDPRNIKKAFLDLKDKLVSKENSFLTFKSRPGISHSLRANVRSGSEAKSRVFALVDIIDDDPADRWLSVCFYDGTVTDDDNSGNLIPEGILGEDGYCFDLYKNEEHMISYLKKRIDEAYEATMISFTDKMIE